MHQPASTSLCSRTSNSKSEVMPSTQRSSVLRKASAAQVWCELLSMASIVLATH